MSSAFVPPGVAWVRPSRRLLALHRTVLAVVGGTTATAAAVAVALTMPWWGVLGALAVPAVVLTWWWLALGWAFRAWGYAERGDDLLVTRGLLVRRLTVVPYGRMQFVDVTAGPLGRAFGIATVRLHTASAATDAAVPGLLPDAAAALRDRLATLGQARSGGL